MTEDLGQSRRAFFSRAWREALTTAPRVVAPTLAKVTEDLSELAPPLSGPSPAAAAIPAPSQPGMAPPPGRVSRTVSVDELVAHAAGHGLGDRVAPVGELARFSVRLTPGAGGTSRLGGSPDLPDGVAWPVGRGGPLPFLATIDLADAAPPHLASEGRLVFFADGSEAAVLSAPLPAAAEAADARALALEPSTELTLPRVWSEAVESLGLDEDERVAWQALRVWLARAQGVELHDHTNRFLVLNRLLGYADETTGDMPLTCELLAAGETLEDPFPRMHRLADVFESRAGRWRLLLQLSVAGRQRVYFWIAAEDVATGDFSRVRVLRRG